MPKLKPLSRQFMSYNFCKSTGNWSLKYRAGKTVNLTNNSVLDITLTCLIPLFNVKSQGN